MRRIMFFWSWRRTFFSIISIDRSYEVGWLVGWSVAFCFVVKLWIWRRYEEGKEKVKKNMRGS